MNEFFKYSLKTTKFSEILEEINHNKNIEISEVFSDVSSLISLCIKEKLNKNVILICENIYQAQKVYDELSSIDDNVCFYPKDDFIAGELLTESFEFSLQRINTLKSIFFDKKKKVFVTNLGALLNKVPRKEEYLKRIKKITTGDSIKPKELLDFLIESGYKRVYTVEKQGEASLRGSIIDIFPVNENHAFRIDFFGNDIESIKFLNIDDQRSKDLIDFIIVMPKEEVFFNESEKDTIKFYIEDKLSSELPQNTRNKYLADLEFLVEKQEFSHLQKYLSLFIKDNYSFIDFIEDDIVCFNDFSALEKSEALIHNDIYNYLSNFEYYFKPSDFLNSLAGYLPKLEKVVYYTPERKRLSSNHISLNLRTITSYESNFDLFLMDLKTQYKNKTVLISLSNRFYPVLEDLLSSHEIPFVSKDSIVKKHKINLYNENFFSFELVNEDIVFINEEKIFKARKSYNTKYNLSVETKRLKSIQELKKGDYVVHYDYGIGIFEDIITMTVGAKTSDYIHILYSSDESLYVPVENLSILYKYTGEDGYKPKLSKLNSKEWGKIKVSAREKAKDLAQRLLNLYSTREQIQGFKYSEDDEIQKEFEDDFEYELTQDQEKAIAEIKGDMIEGKLMDRLVCGDVGFGKTEVAMRAAFKAVLSGKQVALLSPTTILSRQHYTTFKDRMDKFGVEVRLLSRFVSTKDIKRTISDTKEGKCDILIGTHRILSKDVEFKDLGLLIIDEEQKFGVEAKEKIKELKSSIDVITLTATPIPRTLEMAVSGIKNISLIETPPKNRYPVQTYVLERNDYIVKDAIERELSKNGQVFYLYNRVEDIELIYSYIHSLVPDARIAIIHGQMSKERIEDTIDSFINKELDILLSTTIIENGIDMPNVNTLIIHDADRYGLSQLYQLKGRVGRSDKIGYAYLMYNERKKLTEDAQKRLQAIKDFTELGSGFKIAVRDLTTRGAGEILGKEQSGFMNKVGVELYLKMIDEEIKKQKGEFEEESKDDYKIFMSRHIEENYISDDYAKIEAHTKISKLESIKDLNSLKEEFEDRYGEVKEPLLEYMYTKLSENLINKCDFERREVTDLKAVFVLKVENTREVDAESLFKYASDISRNFNFYYKLRRLYIEYKPGKSRLEMYKDIASFLENALADSHF